MQEKIGCTHDYILWGESWTNLQMKISDAPGYGKKKKSLDTDKDIIEFLSDHT